MIKRHSPEAVLILTKTGYRFDYVYQLIYTHPGHRRHNRTATLGIRYQG